jgi:hypothetical protein
MKTLLNHKRISILIAILLALLCVVPALAQDSTADPQPAATADAPVVINVEAAPAANETPVNPDEPWYVKWLASGTAFLITIGVAFRAFNKWLEATKTNPSHMTIGEQVYARLPGPLKAGLVSLIKEFVRLGGNLDEIFAELGDDVPYVVKVMPKDPDPSPSSFKLNSSKIGGRDALS